MSWLSATTLTQLVHRCAENGEVRRAFRGTFPHNRLPMVIPPEKLQLPLTLILNTDTHNLPGQHWTSIYIDRQRRGELFDSLSRPPSAQTVRFLDRYCPRYWVTNSLIYQPPQSTYCGVYALRHILTRHQYNSLAEFCSTTFTYSLLTND